MTCQNLLATGPCSKPVYAGTGSDSRCYADWIDDHEHSGAKCCPDYRPSGWGFTENHSETCNVAQSRFEAEQAND